MLLADLTLGRVGGFEPSAGYGNIAGDVNGPEHTNGSHSPYDTCVMPHHMQIVTHLCYSDFQDIMTAIDRMDGMDHKYGVIDHVGYVWMVHAGGGVGAGTLMLWIRHSFGGCCLASAR